MSSGLKPRSEEVLQLKSLLVSAARLDQSEQRVSPLQGPPHQNTRLCSTSSGPSGACQSQVDDPGDNGLFRTKGGKSCVNIPNHPFFYFLPQPSPLSLTHYPPPFLTIHEYLTRPHRDDGADTCADLIILILDLLGNAPELHKRRRGRGEAMECSGALLSKPPLDLIISFSLLLVFRVRPIAH